jgi:hypothetical protein
MCSACWITKVTNTYTQNKQYLCLPVTTMVVQMQHSITLYIHCISACLLCSALNLESTKFCHIYHSNLILWCKQFYSLLENTNSNGCAVYGCSFGHLLAGIVGSNPAGGMDICVLWVLCVRKRSLWQVDNLIRGVLPVVVSLWSWILDKIRRPTLSCCTIKKYIYNEIKKTCK